MKTMLNNLRIAAFFCLALIFAACPKKPVNGPEPDKEIQSSLDAIWATFVITDIEQICAFGGEGNPYPDFYVDRPGSFDPSSGTGSFVPLSPPPGDRKSTRLNSSHVSESRMPSS